MSKAVVIVVLGAATAAAAYIVAAARATVAETGYTSGSWIEDVYSEAANIVEEVIPVSFSIDDANVHAFLMMIRHGEGTPDSGGYNRLFGGGTFPGYADHPRISVSKSGYTSTAAGAYQILSRTWDDLRSSGVDLPDFSPANQDKAAVALVRRRKALADVKAGRFEAAIAKCNREWASLPGSPYGQPTISMQKALQLIASYGGQGGAVYA